MVSALNAVFGVCFFKPRAACDIKFLPYDGMNADFSRRLIELERAKHIPMVGQPDGGRLMVNRSLNEVGYPAGSVQQTVVGVVM